MSKIFYDHLIVFEDVEKEIESVAKTSEEKSELWQIVDEIVHHKALSFILDKLPGKHHKEFLKKFRETPHDDCLIDYLKGVIGENFEELLKQELGNLAYDLLKEIKSKKK